MNKKYYEFQNEEDTLTWLDNNYGYFLNSIHDNNNFLGSSLYRYTGSMSIAYNEILNSNNGCIDNIDKIIDKYYDKSSIFGEFYLKDAKEDIKLIHNSFSKNDIKNNIVLFHYFNDKNLAIDDIFVINNFISTTMLKKSEGIKKLIKEKKYNSVLKIRVEVGTPCIPIGNNPNSNLKEYEIILQSKSKFRIIKEKRKWLSKIKRIIECEMI